MLQLESLFIAEEPARHSVFPDTQGTSLPVSINSASPDITFEFVQAAIEALSQKLSQEVENFAKNIPEIHEGKKYHHESLVFARRVNKLEKGYQKEVEKIAGQISALQSYNWLENQRIVDLWHSLAIAITNFSEHPTKKVATLIISERNELQSYGINRIPPNIIKRAEHYVRGLRSSYIVCSERMALANIFNMEIKVWWKTWWHTKKTLGNIERAEIKRFSDRIIEAGQQSDKLRNSTMLITTTPCDECAPAIVAHFPHAIIVDPNGGHNFTRKSSFAAAENLIRERGIRIVKLSPTPNI